MKPGRVLEASKRWRVRIHSAQLGRWVSEPRPEYDVQATVQRLLEQTIPVILQAGQAVELKLTIAPVDSDDGEEEVPIKAARPAK
jgi:hypothetical protein